MRAVGGRQMQRVQLLAPVDEGVGGDGSSSEAIGSGVTEESLNGSAGTSDADGED